MQTRKVEEGESGVKGKTGRKEGASLENSGMTLGVLGQGTAS